MLVLAGVNYVIEVKRAWTQAEAARGQLDALADTLIDDMFNRLSLYDRNIMLERLGRLPLHVLNDLPDRLLRASRCSASRSAWVQRDGCGCSPGTVVAP